MIVAVRNVSPALLIRHQLLRCFALGRRVADVFRWWLAGDGMIEHPAYRDAINWSGFDAKADESSRKDVHKQHYPVTAQESGGVHEQRDQTEHKRSSVVRFGAHCLNRLLIRS
jgi:hypothetical protein